MTIRWWMTGLGLALATTAGARGFGETVPQLPAQPLAEAVSAFAANDDAEVAEMAVYAGRIVEVCKAQGCWAVLEDGGESARLMMRDHAFSLPKDYRGPARVLGRLSRVELSEAAAEHLAADGGHPMPVAKVEYRVDTLGVELAEGSAVDGD